jgi:hypothetical protein
VQLAEIRAIGLSAGDGPVTVEIVIGHAQFGRYELALYDTNGENPDVIGDGVSSDNVPDSFPLNTPIADLDGRFLAWSVNIIPAGTGPNEQFSLTVSVRQANGDCQGSPVLLSGPLPAAHAEFGFAKLEVA